MLDAFARRLREARIEARANQSEFAEWGGAKKNSQIGYEAGKTPPTVEYLLNLERHGVDIGYVLTGHRNDGSLGFEQNLLFELFGKLSSREREAVMTLIMTLAGQTTSTAELSAQTRAGRDQLATLHERKQEYRASGPEK